MVSVLHVSVGVTLVLDDSSFVCIRFIVTFSDCVSFCGSMVRKIRPCFFSFQSSSLVVSGTHAIGCSDLGFDEFILYPSNSSSLLLIVFSSSCHRCYF